MCDGCTVTCFADNPCLNGGSCIVGDDPATDYTCICIDGWSGAVCDNCTLEYCNVCSHYSPTVCKQCINGYAVTGKWLYHLLWNKEILDSYCIKENNLCYLKPCKNNATCSGNSAGAYQCDCVDGWAGPNCTECENRKGLNNGKCGMKFKYN